MRPLAALFLLAFQVAPPPTKPNIVLIMADDLGFSDLGCYGSEIRTPNLDRLAGEGVRLTRFYNTGRCCPTRASLLTGLYAHQAGLGAMIDDLGQPGYRGELRADCPTLAEALRGGGYRTDMVGKWHVVRMNLKGKGQVNHRNDDPFWFTKDNWPRQRGFETYHGTIIGVGDFFDPFTLTDGNDPAPAPGPDFYYTDDLTDHAVQRIAERSKSTDPFFLYVAYTAPHWPLHARPEDIERYKDVYGVGWDEIRERRHKKQIELGIVDPTWPLPTREPGIAAWDQAPDHEWEARRMAVYAAQVDRLDQGVGRILKALADAKVDENTLVIFLSDNGGCAENVAQGWFDVTTSTRKGNPVRVGNKPDVTPGSEESYQSYGPAWANVSNTPFRRYKHYSHEGGIATPFIARWPAQIRSKGKILTDPLGHVVDFMPTFLDAAGKPMSASEGRSLLPALTGKPEPPRGPLFWEHEGNRAVRSGDWKLVAAQGKPWELYDLAKDRGETRDLAAQNPAMVLELQQRYKDWAVRVGVQPWPVRKPQ